MAAIMVEMGWTQAEYESHDRDMLERVYKRLVEKNKPPEKNGVDVTIPG